MRRRSVTQKVEWTSRKTIRKMSPSLFRPTSVTPGDRGYTSKPSMGPSGPALHAANVPTCAFLFFRPQIKCNCCAFSGNDNNSESWHRRISDGNEHSEPFVIMAMHVFVLTGERTVAAGNWGEHSLSPRHSSFLFFFFFNCCFWRQMEIIMNVQKHAGIFITLVNFCSL